MEDLSKRKKLFHKNNYSVDYTSIQEPPKVTEDTKANYLFNEEPLLHKTVKKNYDSPIKDNRRIKELEDLLASTAKKLSHSQQQEDQLHKIKANLEHKLMQVNNTEKVSIHKKEVEADKQKIDSQYIQE